MIGITLGDPAGIGPEIALKALSEFPGRRLLLIGSRSALEITARRLGMKLSRSVELLDTGWAGRFRFGAVQRGCGEMALVALEQAVRLLRDDAIEGLVTGPVSKQALRLAGFRFPGQTEFLAERLRAERCAMLAYCKPQAASRKLQAASRRPWAVEGEAASGPVLRIVPVTIHRPLARVPEAVTARLVVEKIELLRDFLRRGEGIGRPRVAVLALNPHGREFTLGEEARIGRAVKSAGAGVSGPFPADSLPILLREYDGIVAMYHDQAMIAAKLLSRGQGVNMTLGLSRVRTSPLHGTAFDIAGQGRANPGSMVAAIRACLRFCGRMATGF